MVAENAKRIMKERGYKQNAIALKAGYSPKAFSNLMNGKKIMREIDIFNIAKALEVAPNELFSRQQAQRV